MATVTTNKKDETAPTTTNAVAAQQQRTTSTESAPATAANAGVQAATDAITASAAPAAAGSTQSTGTVDATKTTQQTATQTASQTVAQQAASSAQQTANSIKTATSGLKVSDNFNANEALQNQKTMLDNLLASQIEQSNNQIDYATQQSIDELQRAEEDAAEEYQTERNQVDLDERKALDNAALYAEARGDKGGIGQTQYTLIQLNAAKNRLAVNEAQTKLSTDTARQIADLRAQGEYSKADAVLSLTQTYLSNLNTSYQWAVELGLNYEQYQTELEQWAKEYELSLANITGKFSDGTTTLDYQQYLYSKSQNTTEQLSTAGFALLEAGVMPNANQLKAMGMTKAQAKSYIKASGSSSSGSTTSKKVDATGDDTVEDDDDTEKVEGTSSSLTRNAEGYYVVNGVKFTSEARAELYKSYIDGDITYNQYSDNLKWLRQNGG